MAAEKSDWQNKLIEKTEKIEKIEKAEKSELIDRPGVSEGHRCCC